MEGYQRHCPTSVMGPRSCQSQCQFVKDLLVTGLVWDGKQIGRMQGATHIVIVSAIVSTYTISNIYETCKWLVWKKSMSMQYQLIFVMSLYNECNPPYIKSRSHKKGHRTICVKHSHSYHFCLKRAIFKAIKARFLSERGFVHNILIYDIFDTFKVRKKSPPSPHPLESPPSGVAGYRLMSLCIEDISRLKPSQAPNLLLMIARGTTTTFNSRHSQSMKYSGGDSGVRPIIKNRLWEFCLWKTLLV